MEMNEERSVRSVRCDIAPLEYNLPLKPRLEDGRAGYALGVDPAIGWDYRPRLLFVYDSRPEVVAALRDYLGGDGAWNALYKAWADAVNRPARLCIKMASHAGDSVEYLELSPADGEPTALLSANQLVYEQFYKHYSVLKNSALWSWESRAESRSHEDAETILVALTDDDHEVVIRYEDDRDNDPEDVLVVGSGFTWMTYEEWVIRKGEESK
jgi:hypothetical protein